MEKNFSFGEIRFALVADHTISVGCVMSCNSHNQYPGGILSPATTALHPVFLAHSMPKYQVIKHLTAGSFLKLLCALN
jgi:hypothetical protein